MARALRRLIRKRLVARLRLTRRGRALLIVCHPLRHLGKARRRAVRAMAPHKVLKRLFFGANAPTWGSMWAALVDGTERRYSEHGKKDLARHQKYGTMPGKKVTKQDLGLARTRAAEQRKADAKAKLAAPAQPAKRAASMKERALRNPDGTLAGSKKAAEVKPTWTQTQKTFKQIDAQAAKSIGWKK